MSSQKPVWAYVYIILSVLFLLQYGITLFFMVLNPFVSMFSGGFSSYWTMLSIVALVIIAVWFYFFRKAIREIKAYNLVVKDALAKESDDGVRDKNPLLVGKKSSWIVIGIFAVCIFLGPGIFTLPIMPLFLAGMSTDSGTTPAYVPILIIIVGYSVMALLGYAGWKFFKKLLNTN
ncbi:hypothetical protein ACFYKX_13455 [Cytobacillus sp. FJAT-54145]|uniref:Uncharacterized protein n=1 Tax=Cytobacillus spartinae TaxID=3299023 RepID=A0ABW6KBI9_9BACI